MNQTAEMAEPEKTKNVSTDEQKTYDIDVDWIAQHVAENPTITTEQVTKWYKESIEKIKTSGLDVSTGNSVIKTAVVSKIQENITVVPTEFQMMILGPYPVKVWSGKSSVEMVAFASMDDKPLQITSISAKDDFVSIKNDIEPLELYKTGFSFFEDDINSEPNRYNLTVQEATKFSQNTKCANQSASYDDKLKSIRDGVPSVNLGDIKHNLSKLKKSKIGRDYTDILDLKKITVQVVGFNDGVAKNGKEWAMYNVIDGTFMPSVKVKSLPVWVDPSIYNRHQAGKGSYLEIYGYISINHEGKISISACFIHPLHIEPMEPEEQQAKTDQPGGVVTQISDEYGIKVDSFIPSSGNMESAGM